MNKIFKIFKIYFPEYTVLGVSYIAPFLLTIYLTRVLGPHEWGKLVIGLLASNFITILIDYGCAVRGQTLIANSTSVEEISNNFRMLINIKILLGFLFFITLYILIYFIRVEYLTLGMLIVLSSFLNSMSIAWYLRGKERFVKNALYENLSKIILLSLIFIFLTKDTGIDIYFKIAISSQIIILLISYLELKKDKLTYYFSLKDVMIGLKEGKNYFLLSIAGVLHNQITLLMLIVFSVGSIYIGFYSNADKIIKTTISIFEPIKNSLFPKFSQHKNRYESLQSIKKLLLIFTPLSFIMGLVVYCESDKIMNLLFNNRNEYAILTLKILSICIILYPINIFIGNLWILSFQKEEVNLKIITFAIILNVFISILLFFQYEFIGILVGSVISELLICLLFFIYFIRTKKIEKSL